MAVQLKSVDINALVDILAEQAAVSLAGVERYLRDLTWRANLPRSFQIELSGGHTGNPKVDARSLIRWAIAKDVNPADTRYTTLGSILQEVLNDVGAENYAHIVAIIIAYRLYLDPTVLSSLKMRYLVPDLDTRTRDERVDIGPVIDWQGPTEILELQKYKQPVPDLFDVGFLRHALEATACVCRIENTRKDKLGTGFLIARGLVLTNYHVLSLSDSTDLEANAHDLVFRFGAITAKEVSESEGQTFRTKTDKAVLKASPINKLDYALLALDDAAKGAEGIKPAKFDLTLPRAGMGLHILQHPLGDNMKIALSTNGVTGVYGNLGLIQYLTSTRGGSSGSPCFNDSWMLIGLHHAERARLFGTIREGILFNAIHAEIGTYLKGG